MPHDKGLIIDSDHLLLIHPIDPQTIGDKVIVILQAPAISDRPRQASNHSTQCPSRHRLSHLLFCEQRQLFRISLPFGQFLCSHLNQRVRFWESLYPLQSECLPSVRCHSHGCKDTIKRTKMQMNMQFSEREYLREMLRTRRNIGRRRLYLRIEFFSIYFISRHNL